jgi:hypothetical protein
VRKNGDPLLFERRIGRLGESSKPFFIPGIEPVLGVVSSKKLVQVGIVRVLGKLHEQERAVNQQRQQQDPAQRDRPVERRDLPPGREGWGTHEHNLRDLKPLAKTGGEPEQQVCFKKSSIRKELSRFSLWRPDSHRRVAGTSRKHKQSRGGEQASAFNIGTELLRDDGAARLVLA